MLVAVVAGAVAGAGKLVAAVVAAGMVVTVAGGVAVSPGAGLGPWAGRVQLLSNTQVKAKYNSGSVGLVGTTKRLMDESP
jgi:hypothetical protein